MQDATSLEARLVGTLTGTSDAALRQHLAVLARAQARLASARQRRQAMAWKLPPAAAAFPPEEVQMTLETPVSLLNLTLLQEPANGLLTRLQEELQAKGIAWVPGFYLGTNDYWTTDRACSVNLPWYLGSPVTAALCDPLTDEEKMRVLRHETGHALLYAYQRWTHPEWRTAFGDFARPYLDAYEPDPARAADYVRNLDRPGQGQMAHYAQKHPDEDWAETFAAWLGGDTEGYQEDSRAAFKLETVALMVTGLGLFYGDPATSLPGYQEPFTRLAGTVADYLGKPKVTPPERAQVAREETEAAQDAVLHEIFFQGLAGAGGAVAGVTAGGASAAPLQAALALAYGSVDDWQADLRQLAMGADAWALTCWDPGEGRLRNLALNDGGAPAGWPVVFACCCHEHAYVPDHGGAGQHLAVEAWFRNLDWGAAGERFLRACPPPVVVPTFSVVDPAPAEAAFAADAVTVVERPVVLPGPVDR